MKMARIVKLAGLGIILYADWRIFLGYMLIKTAENYAVIKRRIHDTSRLG